MATSSPPPEVLPRDGAQEEGPEEMDQCLPSSKSEPDEHPALKPCNPFLDSEPEQQPPPPQPRAPTTTTSEVEEEGEAASRLPRFPGVSVFRLVVAGDKVGGLIGGHGETIKRLCEETRANVSVLEATDGVASRIVLISTTEETPAELAPAMDAAVLIFQYVNGIEGIIPDVTLSASAPEVCSARLLVPKAQAVHLIGKQGATIKLMEEINGAAIRIIDKDELLSCEMVDERIVEIHGAPLKVLHALKSALGLLMEFLVNDGVFHLFERKIANASSKPCHGNVGTGGSYGQSSDDWGSEWEDGEGDESDAEEDEDDNPNEPRPHRIGASGYAMTGDFEKKIFLNCMWCKVDTAERYRTCCDKFYCRKCSMSCCSHSSDDNFLLYLRSTRTILAQDIVVPVPLATPQFPYFIHQATNSVLEEQDDTKPPDMLIAHMFINWHDVRDRKDQVRAVEHHYHFDNEGRQVGSASFILSSAHIRN